MAMQSYTEKTRWAQDVAKADIVHSVRVITSGMKGKPLVVEDFEPRLKFLEERAEELRDLNTVMISTMDADELSVVEIEQTTKFERVVNVVIQKARCAIRRATWKPTSLPDMKWTEPPEWP